MKEIYYESQNHFYFSEKKERTCQPNEIEIKPKVLGLCGSDINKFLNETPKEGYLQTHVLGHEISGIVTHIGSEVKDFKVGDSVVVNPFNIPKDLKKVESFSLCDEKIDIVGRTIDGGYSERIYLPHQCVYSLPKTISYEEAIFIDDIAVAYHGIHYIKEYHPEVEKIAVIGDGPLGILCYRVLKIEYPEKEVVLFAKNIEKIQNLKIQTISFAKIKEYPEQFDVILEVVGRNQSDTLNQAIAIGKKNCLILCYGVFHFNFLASLDVRTLFYKQGMLKGVNSYCNKYDDFEQAIHLLAMKKLKVNDLITNRIKFKDAIEYLKSDSKDKKKIKTIFEVEE